jgi:ATP-dependent DNA helicase RecG
VESTEFDIYPTIAKGMGPDLHWFLGDVSLASLTATLVAMANTMGGTILLGVSPHSGHIQGVSNVEAALDRVFQACLLAEPTLVLPVPRVLKVNQVEVLHITVPQGLPQVYSCEGRYFWREGRQSNPIPPRQLRRLLIDRGQFQFESKVPPGVTIDDLDAEQMELYAREYLNLVDKPFGEPIESIRELLLQRGCLQREGDELRPTYAALLLFGHSPQRWLPTADIMAARFSGISFGDRFIKQEIGGSLTQQLQQVEKFLRANLHNVVRMIGFTHQETLEYPFEAVRELIVNAVAHRDYNAQGDNIHVNIFSDRLEVISPGGLPGPITVDNILRARFSRNPVIVQVLSDLGFVERLGYGLDRVVNSMRENFLAPPKFEEIPGGFRVTLFNTPLQDASGRDLSKYLSLDLNPRQVAALNYLCTHRRIANREYQELCPEVHTETLRRDLADLVSKGILIKIGDKKATYYILK